MDLPTRCTGATNFTVPLHSAGRMLHLEGVESYDRYSSTLSCGGSTFLFSRRGKGVWSTVVRRRSGGGAGSAPEYGPPVIGLREERKLSHNAHFVCDNGTVVAYGGQHLDTKAEHGVQRVQSGPAAGWPLAFGAPRVLLDGLHWGCLELRGAQKKRCDYDGKLTVVRHCGRWLMFSRANMDIFAGARHVQVASSVDGGEIWSAFAPINIANYSIEANNNIYFWNVMSLGAGRLLATYPAVINRVGGIYYSLGDDGLAWTTPRLLLRSAEISPGRTQDHPVSWHWEAGGRMMSMHVEHAVATDVIARATARGAHTCLGGMCDKDGEHRGVPYHCVYELEARSILPSEWRAPPSDAAASCAAAAAHYAAADVGYAAADTRHARAARDTSRERLGHGAAHWQQALVRGEGIGKSGGGGDDDDDHSKRRSKRKQRLRQLAAQRARGEAFRLKALKEAHERAHKPIEELLRRRNIPLSKNLIERWLGILPPGGSPQYTVVQKHTVNPGVKDIEARR